MFYSYFGGIVPTDSYYNTLDKAVNKNSVEWTMGRVSFVQQNKYLPAIVDKETLQYGYLSCGIQIKRFYSGNPFK